MRGMRVARTADPSTGIRNVAPPPRWQRWSEGDAVRLAKVAGAADVRVDLHIWPEMVHVWHLFHPELKAGLRAIETGGAYVRSMMQ